jgi:hypothetical protein
MNKRYFLTGSASGAYFINKNNKNTNNKLVVRHQVYLEHYPNRIIAWCLLLCNDGTVFWTNKKIEEALLKQDFAITIQFFVNSPCVKMKGDFLLSMFDPIKYGFSWLSNKHCSS